MGISQPAVSRLIDALEASLGITHFDRRTGRMVPTVEAQMFYGELQKAVASYDRLASAAEDIGWAAGAACTSCRCPPSG